MYINQNIKSKQYSGFSLVELLVVIAILGILTSFVLIALNNAREKAKIAKAKVFSHNIQSGLGDELVGMWGLDDVYDSGGEIYKTKDGSGSENEGTLVNMDNTNLVEGIIRNGLEFEGPNEYVRISNNPKLNFGTSDDFTVEAWIKTSSSVTHQIVYQKGASAADQPGYRFKVYNNGKLLVQIGDGTIINIWSENTVIDGKWHHIAFTADRDGDAQIYIDGVPDGNPVSIASLGDIDIAADSLIGYAGGSLPFIGIIDEVRVYSQAF